MSDVSDVKVNSIAVPSLGSYTKPSHNQLVELYKPLQIDPEKFMDAYNEDISDYVERHSQRESAMKGGKEIKYLSYSHAYRLFRRHFPKLEVDCVRNPETGGFVFADISNRCWFILAFVHDGERRSALYYFPILNTLNGMGIMPDEMRVKEGKPTGKYVIDAQLINKSIQRAIVKAIALTTGLGLKLWTGDDLDEAILDAKQQLIDKLHQLAESYKAKSGDTYKAVEKLDYTSTTAELNKVQTELVALIKGLNKSVEQPLVETVPPVETKKINKKDNQ